MSSNVPRRNRDSASTALSGLIARSATPRMHTPHSNPPVSATLPRDVTLLPTIDQFPVAVTDSGPATGRVVVLLDENHTQLGFYDAVQERLQVALFRTVVIAADPRLTPKAVAGLLDTLRVPGSVLVGDRAAGDLAWRVAASERGRFTGLVVTDRGHPRIVDAHVDAHNVHAHNVTAHNVTAHNRDADSDADDDCAPVLVDTTLIVSNGAAHADARASRTHVHGDFRIAELAGRRGSPYHTAQLAAEIVLRAHYW